MERRGSGRVVGVLAAVLIVAAVGTSRVSAQSDPSTGESAPAKPPGGDPAQQPARPTTPEVVSAVNGRDGASRAGLGDRITIRVAGLSEADCEHPVLFLAGIPLTDLEAERCDPGDAAAGVEGEIGFHLARDAGEPGVLEPGTAWRALLGRPHSFTREIRLSVGASANRPWPTRVAKFHLVVIPQSSFYYFLLGLGLVVTLFVVLARRSNLLRDGQAEPQPGKRPPYSLSRTQLAFWTLLSVAAYLFIWMVTGELDTLTESVLALLGIGSGTALGASMIDGGKKKAAVAAAAQEEGEKQALGEAIASLKDQLAKAAPGTEAVALTESLAAKTRRLVELRQLDAVKTSPVKRGASGNFFSDVLGDAQGISIQRFQLFVWTVVLGLIFVGSVYRSLAMPEFSNTLLGLMGISSGTYLGFKFPEQHPAGDGEGAPPATP